jgi:hypothetical protein
MLSIVRALVLPVVLTVSLALVAGCGGSPTTPLSGPPPDYQKRYEQQQQQRMQEAQQKLKNATPPDATKTPKDDEKN